MKSKFLHYWYDDLFRFHAFKLGMFVLKWNQYGILLEMCRPFDFHKWQEFEWSFQTRSFYHRGY